MKILCDDQRTDAWKDARRGCITASAAHIALMGRHTKGRTEYVEILADGLEGIPDFETEGDQEWFIDGRFYEDWARGWYSFSQDIDVRQIGFAVHDEYSWIGCSPDGLVDPDGGVEFKYRKALHTFNQHAQAQVVPRAVKAQIQTSLFVCERDWWDYVNYWRSIEHEKEKGHVQRIYRDQAYIDNTLLPAFVALWDDVQREIQRRRAA